MHLGNTGARAVPVYGPPLWLASRRRPGHHAGPPGVAESAPAPPQLLMTGPSCLAPSLRLTEVPDMFQSPGNRSLFANRIRQGTPCPGAPPPACPAGLTTPRREPGFVRTSHSLGLPARPALPRAAKPTSQPRRFVRTRHFLALPASPEAFSRPSFPAGISPSPRPTAPPRAFVRNSHCLALRPRPPGQTPAASSPPPRDRASPNPDDLSEPAIPSLAARNARPARPAPPPARRLQSPRHQPEALA